ncbi:hypothetical protein T4B_10069 [Trichinella pseudospiralis]|nr:hypothetical protein T4B_10069 [Trichinella pseudospiralis]KRZ43305.1 hypothetical protein T4C_13077 [Trichinella pseudospiralis]
MYERYDSWVGRDHAAHGVNKSYIESVDTDEDEVRAVLGLLLLVGVFHNNRLNLSDLYNTDGTDVEIC